MSSTQRPILVTGAGRGIGREIARSLSAAGHPVAVAAMHSESAQSTADEIEATGGVAFATALDVRDSISIANAVAAATTALGSLGGVVNNAGTFRQAPLADQDDELIDEILAIDLAGPIRVARAVVPELRKYGSGRIVNISSDGGRAGMVNGASYAAAKGGVIALTWSLARELARDRISVNTVSPGTVDSDMYRSTWAGTKLEERVLASIPMRRIAQPSEVAAAVTFFCSEQAAYITGQTISVNGGAVLG